MFSSSGKYIILFVLLFAGNTWFAGSVNAQIPASRLAGRILLQVESHGEAWYIDPTSSTRHYLGRPADAFSLMHSLGLGISEADYRTFNGIAPSRLSGRILLRVKSHGEAYYVDPVSLNMHYLGRPADAFAVMRSLGLGITDSDLMLIPEYSHNDNPVSVLYDVPFTSQAPFAEWNNPIFQDGCEEAAILMAMHWVTGEPLTPEDARDGIETMSAFEQTTYGEYHDRSAADTAQLICDYYDYHNITVREDIDGNDIRAELAAGNIMIVPANGQKLGNPHFTAPGPVNHMLVIIGYDAATGEFIVNDPGTRYGKKYRYAESVLLAAIRDYPTGHHEPNDTIDKIMIVIRPES